MASCYHPDGFDDHNVFRGSGHEFARWVVETLSHFEATMHFVASPYVRRDGDVAQVDTYCIAHHIGRPTTRATRPTWSSGFATSTASNGVTADG